jgi:hypothetical protein
MALTVAAFACFVLIFASFFLLVYLVRPEDVTLEARFTQWIILKIRLKYPQSVRKLTRARRRAGRKRQRRP